MHVAFVSSVLRSSLNTTPELFLEAEKWSLSRGDSRPRAGHPGSFSLRPERELVAHCPQGRVEKAWTSQVALPLCSSSTCVWGENVCPQDEQVAGAPEKLIVKCLLTTQWREFRGRLCEGMSHEWWAELWCKDQAGVGHQRDQGWVDIGAREGDVVELTMYSFL